MIARPPHPYDTAFEGFEPTIDAKVHQRTLNKVILPIIRRVMPTIIANDIIGVQPMTGPVGEIFSLKTKFKDDEDK